MAAHRFTHSWISTWRTMAAQWTLTPLRIALIYIVFGLAALVMSDVLFVRYLADPFLSQVQALKGGVEIGVTAGLIFVLCRRYQQQLNAINEQTTRQREELQVLHRVLRHNLRNNLNQILGYTELIQTQNGHDAECESIFRAVEKLERYTEQARRINQVTALEGLVLFDLHDVIPQVINEHERVTQAVTVTSAIPENASIRANHMFPEAVSELLTNAIVHNDAPSPEIAINVETDADPFMTTVTVEDNGSGIPPAEVEPIRERTEDPLRHPSGMGLWFVDWTINHSRGQFTIDAAETGGTTAQIHVPKAMPTMGLVPTEYTRQREALVGQ